MRFNVAQLLKEAAGARRSYEVIGESGPIDDLNGPRPVRGEIEILRTPGSLLVRGWVEIELEAACSRCLVTYPHQERLLLQEEYFPLRDVDTGVALEVPDDPSIFTLDESHTLDLREAVRQYALLALPMKPVCRPDCAGLCPICGVNRNQERCDCPTAAPDPRLAVLAQLRADRE